MRIALFLPNWIGDAVMATPAIRALRERFPEAQIIGVGKPYVAGVLEGSPRIDAWIDFDKRGPGKQRLLSVVRQLRQDPIDLAVIFPNSFRTALLARMGGCRKRVGFARYGRSFLLTDRLQPVRNRRGKIVPAPILLDYNRLAVQAGAPVRSLRMELFTTADDEKRADEVWHRLRFYQQTGVTCLNPGAAFGSAKLWPASYFADLAKRLVDERGSGVLVLCGPAERELARHVVQMANRREVVSIADVPVSLGLTKACVKRCDLLVSTDSGPRHFAAAFGRPVVALFGPTFVNWTDTFFPQEIRLQRKVPCGPCQQRTCHLDHRCMRDLGVNEVYQAVVRLMTRSRIGDHAEASRAA